MTICPRLADQLGPFSVLLATVTLACVSCNRQEKTALPTVLLHAEIEGFGLTRGLSVVALDGASKGDARTLTDGSFAAAGLGLAPGHYSFLVRARAPHADAGGFFVDIDGCETRRRAPIGTWATMAYPFEVDMERVVSISVKCQEPGVVVDQVAIISGTAADDQVQFAELASGPTTITHPEVAGLPCLTIPCRLTSLPTPPRKAGLDTVYHEDFEGIVTGAVGEHEEASSPSGKALHLGMPDGRFVVVARRLGLEATGTIEWWVRPRPAKRLWASKGWHYFLHAVTEDRTGGHRMDLSKHPNACLRFSVTSLNGRASEHVQIVPYPGSFDGWSQMFDDWHHMLVSWDLSGERQTIWLLMDGTGVQRYFPRTFTPAMLDQIEFCNTPLGDAVPYLPMDGAIDEVRFQRVSVAGRLVRTPPLQAAEARSDR